MESLKVPKGKENIMTYVCTFFVCLKCALFTFKSDRKYTFVTHFLVMKFKNESINVHPLTGSGNKTSIPVAIRFNANEESVEDVTKACDSLSSSPIHGNVSYFSVISEIHICLHCTHYVRKN